MLPSEKRRPRPSSPEIFKRPISRRVFLSSLIAMVDGMREGQAFYEAVDEAKRAEIIVRQVPLKGVRERTFLAQTSDIHVSKYGRVDVGVFAEAVDDLIKVLSERGAKPENTILTDTGDVVSMSTRAGKPTDLGVLEECLQVLATVPAGIKLTSPGNHEYGHPDFSKIIDLFHEYGLVPVGLPTDETFIYTEMQGLELPFTLVSTPDYTRHHAWYSSLLFRELCDYIMNRSDDEGLVWVTHNVEFLTEVELSDEDLLEMFANILIEAGHTHGGQVGSRDWTYFLLSIVNFMALRSVGYGSPFVNGLYRLGSEEKNSFVNVSAGVGETKHVRTIRSQIPVLELVGE